MAGFARDGGELFAGTGLDLVQDEHHDADQDQDDRDRIARAHVGATTALDEGFHLGGEGIEVDDVA